jgi:hypothetical protein
MIRKIQPFQFILSFILGLVAVISLLTKFINWGISGPFPKIYSLLSENMIYVWLTILTILLFSSLFNLTQLNRRFLFYEFKDNFTNLDHWDYKGEWRIPETGMLLVTGSDEGGITKVGSNWENYAIQFQARIMEDCLGVIVRAKDLYNYHMFQINTDKIRPHYKYTSTFSQLYKEKNEENGYAIISVYRWEHDGTSKEPIYKALPIPHELKDWFSVKITVYGPSIKIFINNELILDQPSSLKISSGKIGFRNVTSEQALVRNLSVKLM